MRIEKELTPEQNELINRIIEKELSSLKNKRISIGQLNDLLNRITDSIVKESIEKGLF